MLNFTGGELYLRLQAIKEGIPKLKNEVRKI